MLNHIWLAMLLLGTVIGAATGRLQQTVESALRGTETAVTLALGLIGIMCLWLGVLRLAELSGLVTIIARALRPVMTRLFPDVPEKHPAMASMMLNISSNMLGLTNAATPFGLRAMRDLETLNPHPGTATNAMCTFLAINTGSVQLIPASAIAVLATSGSVSPTAVVGSTLAATACSSVVGLTAAKLLERWPVFRVPVESSVAAPGVSGETPATPEAAATDSKPLSIWGRAVLAVVFIGFLIAVTLAAFPTLVGRDVAPELAARAGWVRFLDALSLAAIPFLLSFFPLFAALKGVRVYEEFVEGAREGFQVAVRIIPYLVAMLVAIGVLRGSGTIEWLTGVLRAPLAAVGFPAELVPMSLIRPLSGSASLATFSELVTVHGPDSLIARTAATLYGSTETTFYVLAVYFGAVGVRRVRHAVWAGLAADSAGILAAVVVCRSMFG